MAKAPVVSSGRTYSGKLPALAVMIEPKTTTRITGVSSNIFASGARRSERKLAKAIADVCSDTQGNCFSNSATEGFSTRGAGAVDAARFDFPDVNSPL